MEHAEFIRLAPQLRKRAMSVGLSFFASVDEAEDVAQETLIRIWKAWKGLVEKPSAFDLFGVFCLEPKDYAVLLWEDAPT